MIPKNYLFILLLAVPYVLSTEVDRPVPTAEELLAMGSKVIPITQEKVNCYLGLNEFTKAHFSNNDIFFYIHNFNSFLRNGKDENFPKIPSLVKFKILEDEQLVSYLYTS